MIFDLRVDRSCSAPDFHTDDAWGSRIRMHDRIRDSFANGRLQLEGLLIIAPQRGGELPYRAPDNSHSWGPGREGKIQAVRGS